MINLSQSLAINPFLKILSLTYCGIEEAASQALFEILIFTRSALEEVNLSGNLLRQNGVRHVLLGTSIAKNLKKIYLADNQFNDEEPMVKAIEFCMVKNKTLSRYDFKYNNISDKALVRITAQLMTDATHVQAFEIPPRIEDAETFSNFEKALDANRKAGKKGKKGKGKKKKK